MLGGDTLCYDVWDGIEHVDPGASCMERCAWWRNNELRELTVADLMVIDSDWEHVLAESCAMATETIKIMCPFIKRGAVERAFKDSSVGEFQVLTRFNEEDFYNGVSDTEALLWLLNTGAQIRGIKNLHSKLYIFDERRVIVASANLTESAMHRNLEFGFLSEKPSIVGQCHDYFDGLWARAGENLSQAILASIETNLESERAKNALLPGRSKLPDRGADLRSVVEPSLMENNNTGGVGIHGQSGGSSPADKLRDRFWAILLEEIDRTNELTINRKDKYTKYIRIETGIGGVSYRFVARTKNTSTIELIIQKGAALSRQSLEQLERHKTQVERDLGGSLVWELIGANNDVGRIERTYTKGGFASSDVEISKLSKTMVSDMVLFQRALKPHIDKLGLV